MAARDSETSTWQDASRKSTTHAIEIRDDTVVKRFVSWHRGEASREWNALTILAECTTDLVPEPIEADLVGEPPVIVMSRIDGRSLPWGDEPALRPWLRSIAGAISELHAAVPTDVLDELPERLPSPAELARDLREFFAEQAANALDPFVSDALKRGAEWLYSPALDDALKPRVPPVFGLADGNLANFLWDGSRVRLVDFENSGRSDRAYELADVVEHISFWLDGSLDDEEFLGCFALTTAESRRLVELRRLFALLWLRFLLPGGPAHHRNPPDALHRQAKRLVARLTEG